MKYKGILDKLVFLSMTWTIAFLGYFPTFEKLRKKSHFIEYKEIFEKLVFLSMTWTIAFQRYFPTFEKLRKKIAFYRI